jgi:U3 small nucleolar RNA-associated protein 12
MTLRPDKTGIVTAGADKEIKFFDFEMKTNESGQKVLGLIESRRMQMSDVVLCIRFSPNGKYMAASLVDNTVKIFFVEDLKFYLSLYGHKLPVVSLDISSDNNLIVTASADKNIKIWGLDFGDCHKSLFAHEDNVMQVQFVQDTHYFWSCSKDKTLKYWDADSYECVQTLEGHHASVWALVVSSDGSFVVSGSQDKSLRLWLRTEEQLFLEEEKENALEKMLETSTAHSGTGTNLEIDTLAQRSSETIRFGEQLMEALLLAFEEELKQKAYDQEWDQLRSSLSLSEIQKRGGKEKLLPLPSPSPLFLGMNPSDYVFTKLKEIRSSDLEECLLVLPFAAVAHLLSHIGTWINQGNNVELCTRVFLFILRLHHHQIIVNKKLQPILEQIRVASQRALQKTKDSIGFNKAGMVFLKRQIEFETSSEFFEEFNSEQRQKRKKKTGLESFV